MNNLVIVLFGVTMLYISATSRIEAYIKMLAVQGFCLSIIVALNFNQFDTLNFLFIIIETVGFKTIIIPWFLMKVVRENEISREAEPYITNFYSLLIVSLIFVFGFFIAYWSLEHTQNVKPLHFGVSISTIITGLYIITTKEKLITHTMGYMILENGIFLLSLSVVKEMPIIVNLGVLLDIFIGVLLLGIFINKVKSTFEEVDTDSLTHLKD
jgi:hydrogenase-4 component E